MEMVDRFPHFTEKLPTYIRSDSMYFPTIIPDTENPQGFQPIPILAIFPMRFMNISTKKKIFQKNSSHFGDIVLGVLWQHNSPTQILTHIRILFSFLRFLPAMESPKKK